ncbi:MAG: type I-C CRISPR-associated protein Cas8c/Csd1 [Prevotella sp.]
MILKALYDYYNRCGNLPAKGMEEKEIGFLIVIKEDGTFVRIESRMIDKKQASRFLVLQTVKRSGIKFVPNYLWDNVEYIFGGTGNSEDKNQTFVKMVCELCELIPNSKNIVAMKKFYANFKTNIPVVMKDPLWSEMQKSNKNISFLIEGETKIAAEDKDVWNVILNHSSDEEPKYCLISGIKGIVARLHTTIKLTKDTGPVVSFQKGMGFDSYGKEQAYNAPISEYAEFAYTTALNSMLQRGSRNKFMLGTRTFVFWASNNSEASIEAEESLFELLGFSEEVKDDPNANLMKVRKVFESIYSGILKTDLDDKFYILGLAPNSARIAVIYWSETTLKDFAEKILKHFSDMEIHDTRKDKKPYMGIREIISSVTLGGKMSDATPNLPEAVVKSIFQGLPYPATLYSACIRRIRAEQKLTITRAAIIKAYLNRQNNNNKKIEIMLDKDNNNQGYLCGRLFAVLDKIQEDANNISSIRERYMNAASATPSSVFATILNLSVHHSEKLDEGRRIYFEKLKQEIIDKMSANGFPTHLDLQDQGRFFVGYYHQRQDFFTSKKQ